MSATVQQFTFESEDADDEAEMVFRVVDAWENSYGDNKVAVETPAPWEVPDEMTAPNTLVKSLEWEDHHYSFDGDREAWTLDHSGVKALAEKAEDAGYGWEGVADRRRRLEGGDDEGVDETLKAVAEDAEEGDRIVAEYEQKNGNGRNTYKGEVEVAQPGRASDDPWERRSTGIVFRDTDGKTKKVKADDEGTPALFSSGYHPFMGELVSVKLVK